MPRNINVVPVNSRATQLAIMAAYYNGSGDGANLKAIPYSNAINVQPTTVIGNFTQSTYTGAMAQSFAPGAPYYDQASGVCRVNGGAITFAGTDGVQQTMSFPVVGPVTMNGTVVTTVTAAGETGSPRAVTATVATTMSNAQAAAVIAGSLAEDADVSGFFAVTSIGDVVQLKALTAAANDATMNAALSLGTATGIVPVATATQVAAGVAPGSFVSDNVQGIYVTDLGGNYVTAFPFGQSYPITAPSVGVTVDMDIPYGA
jgi:hypothetical protein